MPVAMPVSLECVTSGSRSRLVGREAHRQPRRRAGTAAPPRSRPQTLKERPRVRPRGSWLCHARARRRLPARWPHTRAHNYNQAPHRIRGGARALRRYAAAAAPGEPRACCSRRAWQARRAVAPQLCAATARCERPSHERRHGHGRSYMVVPGTGVRPPWYAPEHHGTSCISRPAAAAASTPKSFRH